MKIRKKHAMVNFFCLPPLPHLHLPVICLQLSVILMSLMKLVTCVEKPFMLHKPDIQIISRYDDCWINRLMMMRTHVCPRKSLFTAREAQVTDAQRSNGTKPNQTKPKLIYFKLK